MDLKYLDWIYKTYPDPESATGKELDASIQLVKEFPELILCYGMIYKHRSGYRCEKIPHWWAKQKNGEVIDPTINQFRWAVNKMAVYDEIFTYTYQEILNREEECSV